MIELFKSILVLFKRAGRTVHLNESDPAGGGKHGMKAALTETVSLFEETVFSREAPSTESFGRAFNADNFVTLASVCEEKPVNASVNVRVKVYSPGGKRVDGIVTERDVVGTSSKKFFNALLTVSPFAERTEYLCATRGLLRKLDPAWRFTSEQKFTLGCVLRTDTGDSSCRGS